MGVVAAVAVALSAMATTVLVTGAGAYVKKRELFPPVAQKSVSKLVVHLFLPALLLSRVANTVSPEHLVSWAAVPLIACFMVAAGASLGYLLVLALARHDVAGFAMAAVAFGNTTSLPLAMMASLAHGEALRRDEDDSVDDIMARGTAYVLVFTLPVTLLRWTVAYDLMGSNMPRTANAAADYSHVIELAEQPAGGDDGDVEEVVVGGEEEQEGDGEDGEDGVHVREAVVAAAAVVDEPLTLRQRIRKMFNPPIYASLLGIAIGLVTPVKGLLFGSGAPLAFVTNALTITGEATVPAVMIGLGATLYNGPNSASVGRRLLGGILVLRLVCMPLVGFAVIHAFDRFGWLPADPTFRAVMMLEFATPPAINLSTMATLHGRMEKETGTLLFWAYLAAVPCLSLSVLLILSTL